MTAWGPTGPVAGPGQLQALQRGKGSREGGDRERQLRATQDWYSAACIHIGGESKLWRLRRDVIPRPYLHFSLQQFDGQLPDVQRYGVVYSDGLSGEGLPSQIGLEWLRRQTAP